MKYSLGATVIAGLMLVGCGPTARTYSVAIKNNSIEPVTLWLTKDGRPAEQGWLSPEQVVWNGLDKGNPVPFQALPPGKTAEIPAVTGHFEQGAHAILRIYRGARRFSEILAISDGSPLRQDIVLKPGRNELVVDHNGQAALK